MLLAMIEEDADIKGFSKSKAQNLKSSKALENKNNEKYEEKIEKGLTYVIKGV
jgi:hypothetical protein